MSTLGKYTFEGKMKGILKMSTFLQKKENIERKWYVIDASGISLGRVASKAATILRGKHKPTYTPSVDCCLLYTSRCV